QDLAQEDHGPARVGSGGNRQWLRTSRRKPLLAPSPLARVQGTVQPVYPLVIPSMTPASKHLEQFAEAVGGIAFSRDLKRGNHWFIPGSIRPIPVHRVTDASDSTGSTDADAVSMLEVIHQFSPPCWRYSFFSISSFSCVWSRHRSDIIILRLRYTSSTPMVRLYA